MARFQPRLVIETLNKHGVRYVLIGGVAATLHGSPLRTGDTDICPAADHENLEKLAAALRELKARIRTEGVEGGLPFSCDASFIARIALLNLETEAGDLDVSFQPAGTAGYDDLIGRDEPYIRMLKSQIDRFNEELDALTERLVCAGATRVAA